MAFMGNMTTANADEINPNNFASRPGVFSVKSTTSSDYLFGSNMGLQTPENNLTISHSKIKRSLPYPTTLGDCGPGHLGGTGNAGSMIPLALLTAATIFDPLNPRRSAALGAGVGLTMLLFAGWLPDPRRE